MRKLIDIYLNLAKKLSDIPPLLFRLTLAYGFYEPAMQKLNNFEATRQWFETLGIPFPGVNLAMAVTTEVSGIILLTLGLATRFISVPMIFVMGVAVATVHWKHGFSCGHNGFEVPFYYALMLLSLITTGPGKFSVDHLISKRKAE